MVAEGSASSTATVKNSSTIIAANSVGMVALSGTGTSIGINSGTINVTTGTGVFVKGTNAQFNGNWRYNKSDRNRDRYCT